MKKIVALLIACFTVLSANAHAAGIDDYLVTKEAYVFGTVGLADNVLESGLHYAAGVGAPLVSYPNINVEASAGMYGEQTRSIGTASTTYGVSHFGAAAVYNLPIKDFDNLTAFAKAGLNYVSATSKVPGYSSSSSAISLAYGIGAQYKVNKQIDVRVQYENLGGEWITYGSLNAGVVYRFQ